MDVSRPEGAPVVARKRARACVLGERNGLERRRDSNGTNEGASSRDEQVLTRRRSPWKHGYKNLQQNVERKSRAHDVHCNKEVVDLTSSPSKRCKVATPPQTIKTEPGRRSGEGNGDGFRVPGQNAFRQVGHGTSRASLPFTQSLEPISQASPAPMVRSSSNRCNTQVSTTRPIERPSNLLRPEKPVHWRRLELSQLRSELEAAEDRGAVFLFDNIHRQSMRRRRYLPLELKDILVDELLLVVPDDDACFERRVKRELTRADKEHFDMLRKASLVDQNADIANFTHLEALYSELRTLRQVVRATNDFTSQSRSAAAWNTHIHNQMLQLAVQNMPSVVAEDAAHARIASESPPPTRRTLLPPLGSEKLDDYVLVLRLGPGETLQRDQVDFVSGLETRTFNQPMDASLCTAPAGVFITINVEGRRHGEGQAQLGLWITTWLGRVSDRNKSNKQRMPIPCLPVMLVVGDDWQLWFVIDKPTHTDVCGPVHVGKTSGLDDAYRLLATLRLLAGWMEGGFREWVH